MGEDQKIYRIEMIFCPLCLHKINIEQDTLADGYKCQSCKQIINNMNSIPCVSFPDCVSKIRYVGLNSWQDANMILKMMQ
jgi:DNA-directed RNA polymerase subunit RPC12/RpoP